jgi:lipopolysaccharide transport system ATP-binding protein
VALILEIKNLYKKYQIKKSRTDYLSLREQLIGSFNKSRTDYFWALKDINIDIESGESVGIIGRNGAGKSTLLKILSRITPPTGGYIKARGRVASLLEVGTGFHPELSGRENIYLNGSILGLRREEIKTHFDEIVDFSGVETFLDTALKHYSSGMQLRLAFAVAAHLEPEILLIDEVLAVGDAAFQKKCIGKMNEVSKSGRTVVFVSHDINALRSICDRGIILQNGIQILDDDIEIAVESYMSGGYMLPNSKSRKLSSVDKDEPFVLLKTQVTDNYNKTKRLFKSSEEIIISIEYKVQKSNILYIEGLNIHHINGTNIFDSHNLNKDRNMPSSIGIYNSFCAIPANLLNEGRYVISIAFFNPSPLKVFSWYKEEIEFEVYDDVEEKNARGDYRGKFPGIVRPLLSWKTKKSE